MFFTVMPKNALTENQVKKKIEKYWETAYFNENSIIEMLVDGDIEVIEIVKEL